MKPVLVHWPSHSIGTARIPVERFLMLLPGRMPMDVVEAVAGPVTLATERELRAEFDALAAAAEVGDQKRLDDLGRRAKQRALHALNPGVYR